MSARLRFCGIDVRGGLTGVALAHDPAEPAALLFTERVQ
jgi:hypothetical protein